MVPCQCDPATIFVKEGDVGGDLCYLLETGDAMIKAGGELKDEITGGHIFGELALMYNVPRTATVEAKSAVTYFTLHRSHFQSTLHEEAVGRRRETYSFLRSVPAFEKLDMMQLSRVADVVSTVSFKEGVEVIKQGEPGDAMYIVQSGQVVVKREDLKTDEAGKKEEDILLTILKKGQYFGERALLVDEPRSATIEAVTDVTCLTIDRRSFIELLGLLHSELTKKMEAQTASSPAAHRKSADAGGGGAKPEQDQGAKRCVAFATYRPKMENLKVLKPLGAGGFARVLLARDNQTRCLFALKVINKKRLVSNNAAVRTASVLSEKRCLEECHHPFVLSMTASYQDLGNLYFLIDLQMGGELFRVMEEVDRLPEPMARFYIGSIVLALQHIHLLQFVYRDLKPENILLDSVGFIKVCDFGFAKKIVDRTYTQCGTPDYVAPEMLMGQGVNQACDWWALGVLLYEMCASVPPFTDAAGRDMQTFANILKGEVTWPEDANFSGDMKSLIDGLLQVKVGNRLGYLKNGAEDIIQHAWFGADRQGKEEEEGKPTYFDFDSLANRTMEPAWRPQLRAADDVAYFDPEGMMECLQLGQGESVLSEEEHAKYQESWDAFSTGVAKDDPKSFKAAPAAA